MNESKKQPKVWLTGAGPGDPALITLRAVEVLKKADCVICDRLVNKELLSHVSPDAEIINAPKRLGPGAVTQDEVNELLISKVRDGKSVVRLKGSDTAIFARTAEEARLLAKENIDFEIIPGVTAASAAGAYTGIFLTDRTCASQVMFVTGRHAPEKKDDPINWSLLTRFNGTIVFYMSIGIIDKITEKLISCNMNSDKPVAVVCNASLPDQKFVTGTLKDIAQKVKDSQLKPPGLIIVGKAAVSNPKLYWFAKKPLRGKKIVTTRDRKGNQQLATHINRKGATAIQIPAIKLKSRTYSRDFLEIIQELKKFHWIVFTSPNGVEIFFDWLGQINKDARAVATAKIAAIGKQTAIMLKDNGIIPDFVPASYTSRDLGKGLIEFTDLKDRRILLLRSQQASEELSQLLTSVGAIVSQSSLYSVEKQTFDTSNLKKLLRVRLIDWITFASPSSVKSFFEQIDPDTVKYSKIASIGPVTSKAIEELGLSVDAQPKVHTVESLLDEIERFVR